MNEFRCSLLSSAILLFYHDKIYIRLVYLSKRLRKKIAEVAGLDKIPKDERVGRARALLDDADFKRRLCNKMPGLDFKTIEKCLKGIITAERPKATDEEILRSTNPEKFDGLGSIIPLRISRPSKMTLYTKEETIELVMASNAPYEDIEKKPVEHIDYPTYTAEEVLQLINSTFGSDIKYSKSNK